MTPKVEEADHRQCETKDLVINPPGKRSVLQSRGEQVYCDEGPTTIHILLNVPPKIHGDEQ